MPSPHRALLCPSAQNINVQANGALGNVDGFFSLQTVLGNLQVTVSCQSLGVFCEFPSGSARGWLIVQQAMLALDCSAVLAFSTASDLFHSVLRRATMPCGATRASANCATLVRPRHLSRSASVFPFSAASHAPRPRPLSLLDRLRLFHLAHFVVFAVCSGQPEPEQPDRVLQGDQ